MEKDMDKLTEVNSGIGGDKKPSPFTKIMADLFELEESSLPDTFITKRKMSDDREGMITDVKNNGRTSNDSVASVADWGLLKVFEVDSTEAASSEKYQVKYTLEKNVEDVYSIPKEKEEVNLNEQLLDSDLLKITESDIPQSYVDKHQNEYVESKKALLINDQDMNPSKEILEKMQAPNNSMPLDYWVKEHFIKNHVIKCSGDTVFLYDEHFGIFKELSDNELQIEIRRLIPQEVDMKLSKHKMADVVHRLKCNPDLQVKFEDFNSRSDLINFRDVVVNTTGEFFRHSEKYMFTSYIDANYKTDDSPYKSFTRYVDENGEMVTVGGNNDFLRFLNDCTEKDQKKIESLQQLTGYIISSEWRAKKFFVLIGLPHTGKSVWLSIWRALIGSSFTTAMSLKQLAENRFMSAELFHSKLNITAELDGTSIIKGMDLIKAITGGDLITGERKGKDPFQFHAKTKLVAAGNSMPSFKLDGTTAITDRIMFLTFNNTIPEKNRDKALLDRLLTEESRTYIVEWAIEGWRKLMRNNMVFTESDDAITFKNQYINELNTVPDFVREKCFVNINNLDLKVHRRDLYPVYINYCRDNGIKAISQQEFFEEIMKFGVKKDKFRMHHTSALNGFRGIKLVPKEINEDQGNTSTTSTEDEMT